MNQFMFSGLVVLMAYLIGSISFAVVVSKLMGLPDPHSYGSGNPGATNVLRTGSKAAAVRASRKRFSAHNFRRINCHPLARR